MNRVNQDEGHDVDRFARSDVSRRQLLAGMAGLAGVSVLGLGSWATTAQALTVEPATMPGAGSPRHSGLLMRIRSVDPRSGVSIAGIVQPAALPFWYLLAEGEWRHRTTSGDGWIEVDGQRVRVPKGASLVIPAGRRISYRNDGDKPWSFEAQHPIWSSAALSCGIADRASSLDRLLFDLRRSPRHPSTGAVYRLVSPHASGKRPRIQGLVRAEGISIHQLATHENASFGDPASQIRPPAERTPAAILWGLQRPHEVQGVPAWFELVA